MRFRCSKRVFIHVDCDSFFASCEILKKPYLKNSYVIVGEEIVLACNYKTKALWIKTWTPIWEAKRILKWKWVYLSWDYSYYSKISYDLMNYLAKNTLSIEPFSIDEAFCDITWLAELNKLSLEDYTKKLQKDILKEVKMPVSIWVSNTRIKAKIFSKINKPFGIHVSVSSIEDKELFQKLPISIVPFIGKSYQSRLEYKASTVYDFISLWYWFLKDNIWKSATDLWLELSWVNSFRLNKSKYSKSMSRWRSFNKNMTNNQDILFKRLIINFSNLYEELIERNYELKRVSIFLRTKEFITYTYDFDFRELTCMRQDIFKEVCKLLKRNFDTTKLYRSTWIVFSKLKKRQSIQMSFFDNEMNKKEVNLKLSKTINFINNKYEKDLLSYWINSL